MQDADGGAQQDGGSNITHQSYADVVAAIRATSRDPLNWKDALTDLAAYLRSAAVSLVLWQADGQKTEFTATPLSERSVGTELFVDSHDIRTLSQRSISEILVSETHPAGRATKSLISVLKGTGRYYELWLSRHCSPALLRVYRSTSQAPFRSDDVAKINSFAPNLRLALNFGPGMAAQDEVLDLIGVFLDRLNRALILVDVTGRILYRTLGAVRLFATEENPACFGALSLSDPMEHAKLLAAASQSIERGATKRLILSSLAQRPAEVMVFPLLPQEGAHFLERGVAAIVATRRAGEGRVQQHSLMELYGLTATEARLAIDLFCGKRVVEVSQSRGVSLATVRAQLRAVLAKTDTHRQLDLVRLLSHLADRNALMGWASEE
jgi:DNA-binding CsgD family transcriptional regulator